ncbi:MAG: serine--tRNA ligase, partial [Cetobacterium sp.]
MLDLRFIRENIDMLQEMLVNRGSNIDLQEFVKLDTERREILSKVEMLKNKRNTESAEVARRKKAGEDASEIIAEMGKVSAEIKELDAKLAEVEE